MKKFLQNLKFYLTPVYLKQERYAIIGNRNHTRIYNSRAIVDMIKNGNIFDLLEDNCYRSDNIKIIASCLTGVDKKEIEYWTNNIRTIAEAILKKCIHNKTTTQACFLEYINLNQRDLAEALKGDPIVKFLIGDDKCILSVDIFEKFQKTINKTLEENRW